MHHFPKDESLQRLWNQFVRRHRANFVPSQYSALCSVHFAPTCYKRKLLLGAEADWKSSGLLKRGSVPTIDAVGPATDKEPAVTEHEDFHGWGPIAGMNDQASCYKDSHKSCF